MGLPTFLERDSSRSSMGSTLSIAPYPARGSPRQSTQIDEMQAEAKRQLEILPLEQQDWWEGDIGLETATDKIKSLAVGTFLVRGCRVGETPNLALDLKARRGVKHMKIYVESDGEGLLY